MTFSLIAPAGPSSLYFSGQTSLPEAYIFERFFSGFCVRHMDIKCCLVGRAAFAIKNVAWLEELPLPLI